MSDKTYGALDDAIRAHVAEMADGPVIVTDWVVISATEGMDAGTKGYFYSTRVGMPAHTLTGLLMHFLDKFRWRHAVQGEDDAA